MKIYIGVDEAGYGPNYGPLVVAATVWSVEDDAAAAQLAVPGSKDGSRSVGCGGAATRAVIDNAATDAVDFYKVLRNAVRRTPDKAGRKLAIADSKALYSPQLGLRQLERGVLAALVAMRTAAANAAGRSNDCFEHVAELLAATGADPERRRHELPCHWDDALPLPIDSLAEEIGRLAEVLHEVCRTQGVVLVTVRARLVYPSEFNALVERWGSKGAALSHVTMQLVRRTVDQLAESDAQGPISILFDKHGGRSRYAALLQHHFSESWIEPISENRNRSRYRWQHSETPIEAVFRVGCEELMPTALASMAAKYHRELAMRAFNAFWTSRVPGLRPTAGYPGDSRRFRADIAAAQTELGIADEALWRCR